MPKRSDGRTFQRSETGPWWIEYYDAEGKQQRESTGLYDFKAADAIRFQRIVEKRQGVVAAPNCAKITVGELLNDLMDDVRQSGRHVELATYHCNHLRSFFGATPASKVGTDKINEYGKARLAEGVCGGTINRELGRLRRAFQLGADREPPKVMRVPKIRKLAENAPREGFLEPEQYTQVLNELPEYLRPVFAFGYFVGCRVQEILTLKWDQVDLAACIVNLSGRATKTKRPRAFAMPAPLKEMIQILHEQRQAYWPECDRVFTRAGEPIADIRTAWDSAVARAGCPELLFHDLRRTALRNMIRAGIPEEVAMRVSGHRSRDVFRRYNIVSERDLVDVGRKVTEYHAETVQKRPTKRATPPRMM